MANDGLWYNGCTYTSAYEYLYDFYADYASLDVPRCLITDFLNADDLIRENTVTSSDDCTARRYDGNGWYLYVPTVAVEKTIGQDSWYSAYCDGSTLCVDKSYDSVEMMEDFYREGGFTLEQYREGAALSGRGRATTRRAARSSPTTSRRTPITAAAISSRPTGSRPTIPP